MSYPAELLEDDLGAQFAPQRRQGSGFAALGELLGGGIDRQGAFMRGQLTSAKTQDAIERARLTRSQAGIAGFEYDALNRLATERPDVYAAGYSPIDLILAKRGSDFSAATQGHLNVQEYDNRETLGDALATAPQRQAAGDAVKGDFKAYEPVGSDAYYSTTDIAGGVHPVPAPPDSLAARKRTPVGYRYTEDGGNLEYIPGGPADPATQRPPPKGYRYDQNGQLIYVAGGPADPLNNVDNYRRNPEGTGVEPIPGAPAKVAEGVATAAGFYDRMVESEKLIGSYAPSFKDFSAFGYVLDGGPAAATIASSLMSPEGQSYYQAAADWVRAKLRKESGAAIGEKEMLQEIRTYFPLPGEPPEIIAQKAAARKVATSAVRRAGAAALPLESAPAPEPRAPNLPRANAKGWRLQRDDQGNLAYVSPDGTQFEEVK